MHTIEFENGEMNERMEIVQADCETLTLAIREQFIHAAVEDYLMFGEALVKAYHELNGRAILLSRSGQSIVEVLFRHNGVMIYIGDGETRTLMKTDQSYMTSTLKQVGIWE